MSDPRGQPCPVRNRPRRRDWLTLVAIALMGVSSGALLCQAPQGALAGKLTDIDSRPLIGVTVTLRNALSGKEVRAVTEKGGKYRFGSLAPGEYALEAASPELGKGKVGGIFISGGHESHVQTAVALTQEMEAQAGPERGRPAPLIVSGEPASRPTPSTSGSDLAENTPTSRAVQAPLEPAEMPAATSAGAGALLELDSSSVQMPLRDRARPAEAITTLPAHASMALEPDSRQLIPKTNEGTDVPGGALLAVAANPTVTPHVSAALGTLPMAATGIGPGPAAALVAVYAAKMALAVPWPPAPIVIADSSAADGLVITGDQMEQLPLPGRHWENFVLETPASGSPGDAEGGQSGPASREVSVTVDGASTRLAFGGHAGTASVVGPAGSESSIQEFRVDDRGEAGATAAGGDRINLETRGGTSGLHGRAFLFDRQNILGARNPFTQWVKETAPGSLVSVPVFTPFPFTPGNREDRWGAGVGGGLRWNRIFWFASVDGDERNHPAVSTVKHSDHFFAQPSNDEMQVLSARLGLSNANPVAEGVQAYSGILESLAGLLGPAPRTSQHWSGFGRLDWKMGERHRFSLEGSGASWNSPGGGLARAAETFGNHSFGAGHGSSSWVLGRWEAFLTPNLLAVTQGSIGRVEVAMRAGAPSPFEQAFNANLWGQLPQMTVDSRYGFTIGNPARFGPGKSPDEHVYEAQETLSWVHGPLLVKAGFDLRHNADSTSLLTNHTGTFFYSSVENFASDALVFAKYGLTDALDPTHQHNCDQRGKAWRDTTGQLHGLGYLPCYSYFKQTLGPTNWHLSTNDWAGFATTQWQPAKQLVMTASLRWDREELPPPIALVNNPDLPLTQHMPTIGSEWSPRLSLAWGKGESRWPVLRAGYGFYSGRTSNSVLETALTNTGSLKGDLSFFMRPTDNMQFKGGGAPPFPYAFGGLPGSVEKPGAVEFAPKFQNPEIQQGVAEMEQKLPGRIVVTVAAMVSLARKLPVTMDTNYDPSVNPKTITYAVVDATGKGPLKSQITVPFFASWPVVNGTSGRLNANYQQITELVSRANSTYEAATVRVSRNGRRGLSFHVRYAYGHAMDWNPNESSRVTGSSVLDPTDFSQEYGTSNLDVRHTASAMAIWEAPWNRKGADRWLTNGWMLSATAQFHSGLPYTMRTAGSITRKFETTGETIAGLGPGMNGYGGDDRVYGVGRNTFRNPHTWKADVRLGRKFSLGRRRELELLAESFNLFNHQNVTEVEKVGYSIEPGSLSGTLPTLNFLTGLKTGQTEFGQPLNINAVDFYRERQFDLGLRVRF